MFSRSAALRRYRELMWPAVTGEGTGASRLEQALDALYAGAEEHLDLLIALRARTDAVFHEAGPEPRTREVFTELLARLLRDGAADGSLREGDPDDRATVLFNLVG